MTDHAQFEELLFSSLIQRAIQYSDADKEKLIMIDAA